MLKINFQEFFGGLKCKLNNNLKEGLTLDIFCIDLQAGTKFILSMTGWPGGVQGRTEHEQPATTHEYQLTPS